MFHNIIKHNGTCQKKFLLTYLLDVSVYSSIDATLVFKSSSRFCNLLFFYCVILTRCCESVLAFSLNRCWLFHLKDSIYRNYSHDYILNHTGLFQLSPLATWFQETTPKYFMQMLAILEEFYFMGWKFTKTLRGKKKKKNLWGLKINSQQQGICPLCLGAREGEIRVHSPKHPASIFTWQLWYLDIFPSAFPPLSDLILQGISCYTELT